MRSRVLALLALLLLAGGTPALADAGGDPGPESRLLVTLDTWPPPASLAELAASGGGRVVASFEAADTLLVEAPASRSAGLADHPAVAGVRADEPLQAFLASSKAAAGVTEEIQRSNLSGAGVNVAVVDGGVAGSHPGLDDAVQAQYSVDDDGVHEGGGEPSKHGTHVAGILAGSGEGAPPSRGDVSGVAPGAGLVSFDISREFTTSNALRAFEWIYEHHGERDIRVVASAWGRLRNPATYEPDDPVVRASSALESEGLVVVFSAGNGGGEESRMTVEAANPDVIAVGAATDGGEVETYSSRGPVYDEDGDPANWTKPDLVAPGSHVVSTQPDGAPGPRYIKMNGTSMAAPHAAGAAALLLDHRSNLTPEQVEGLLRRGARDVGPAGTDDRAGSGMLDVEASLRVLENSSGGLEQRSRTDEHSSQLTGPAEAGAVLSQANVEHEDSFRVPVPANATRLEATIAWGGDGELRAQFERPDGSPARSEAIEDRRTVEIAEPERGDWTVTVEPADAARGSYEAETTVTWLEPVNGSAIPLEAERTAGGSFPATEGPLSPLASSWIPGVPNWVPMLAGAALSVSTLVARARE